MQKHFPKVYSWRVQRTMQRNFQSLTHANIHAPPGGISKGEKSCKVANSASRAKLNIRLESLLLSIAPFDCRSNLAVPELSPSSKQLARDGHVNRHLALRMLPFTSTATMTEPFREVVPTCNVFILREAHCHTEAIGRMRERLSEVAQHVNAG